MNIEAARYVSRDHYRLEYKPVGGDWVHVKGDAKDAILAVFPNPTPFVPVIPAEDVDVERDRRLVAGFEFQGKMFQSRPADITNIMGAALEATIAIMNGVAGGDFNWDGTGEPFGWIAADNTPVPMDAPTVQEFGKAAAAHRKKVIRRARALKDMSPIPPDYADDTHWG